MSNVLFIGRFYPKGVIENIVEDTYGKVGFSNHNFELSLIEGFSKLPDINLRVLTAPMVYSYPHNNKNAFIKSISYCDKNYTVKSIGFCNIAIINFLSQKQALCKAIRKEIYSFNNDNEIAIIVNTPSLVLSSALFQALHNIKGKKIKTTVIVPDVPECLVEMNGKMTIKNRLVQQLNKRNARLSLFYNKYVYLTEAMNDFFHSNVHDYIVMEGLIDESRISSTFIAPNCNEKKEIILYTGTLRRIFGVMELIEAFKKANLNNAELWICGSGECANEIIQQANKNPRIRFYGLVSSQLALELQLQATILANPRSSTGSYTRYSFPSKTIEYLLAGRTVIMNRLPGIPNEYDKFIEYPDDESIESWANKLNEIVNENKNIRLQRSLSGRNFILDNKTAVAQCKRILDFINQ